MSEQLQYVAGGSGAHAVQDTGLIYPLTSGLLTVPNNGFLYIYVSNETQSWNVYFDNLVVQHFTGPELEILSFVLTASCKLRNKCAIKYADFQRTYCVEVDDEKSLLNKLEKGRFIFYQPNDSATEAGFYVDGFRNETWFYFTPDSIIQIQWSHYLDNSLHFETNLFARADSVIRGNFFTKFKFTTPISNLNLTVSINGPFKDSMPEKRYKEITINEFNSINVDVISFNQSKLSDANNTIYINDIVVESKAENNKRYYLKNAFGHIKGSFIEFTTMSPTNNDFYRDRLFEGVLTNFYLDGNRLYYPFTLEN